MNIGYIRVSTDKQENSVETQKDTEIPKYQNPWV